MNTGELCWDFTYSFILYKCSSLKILAWELFFIHISWLYQFTKFRLASRSIYEPHLSYSDACVAVLYHFVFTMQTHPFALWVLTAIRYITNIVRFFLLIARTLQVLLLPTMKHTARNPLHICKIFCSMKRAHQVSFIWTYMPILVRTVFNGLRFNESPLLRTLDTDTWLLQNWLSCFGVTRVVGLQGGQHSYFWLTNKRNVLKEIKSGKYN